MGSPFKLKRGQVYVVQFYPPDDPTKIVEKFCVCLQEGKIVDNSPTFVGVNITTERLDKVYPDNVFLSAEESNTPSGAKVICNQIHTYPKTSIKKAVYCLSETKMQEINEKLMLGVGIIKIEDLKNKY